MTSFNLKNHKTPASVYKRCYTKAKSFDRSILFDSAMPAFKPYKINLEADEIPIFESHCASNYLLLTTSYFHSFYNEEIFSVRIEDIIYVNQNENIQIERKKRGNYMEYIDKELQTKDGKKIPFAVSTGAWEQILNSCLVDIVWMCNKYNK